MWGAGIPDWSGKTWSLKKWPLGSFQKAHLGEIPSEQRKTAIPKKWLWRPWGKQTECWGRNGAGVWGGPLWKVFKPKSLRRRGGESLPGMRNNLSKGSRRGMNQKHSLVARGQWVGASTRDWNMDGQIKWTLRKRPDFVIRAMGCHWRLVTWMEITYSYLRFKNSAFTAVW